MSMSPERTRSERRSDDFQRGLDGVVKIPREVDERASSEHPASEHLRAYLDIAQAEGDVDQLYPDSPLVKHVSRCDTCRKHLSKLEYWTTSTDIWGADKPSWAAASLIAGTSFRRISDRLRWPELDAVAEWF